MIDVGLIRIGFFIGGYCSFKRSPTGIRRGSQGGHFRQPLLNESALSNTVLASVPSIQVAMGDARHTEIPCEVFQERFSGSIRQKVQSWSQSKTSPPARCPTVRSHALRKTARMPIVFPKMSGSRDRRTFDRALGDPSWSSSRTDHTRHKLVFFNRCSHTSSSLLSLGL